MNEEGRKEIVRLVGGIVGEQTHPYRLRRVLYSLLEMVKELSEEVDELKDKVGVLRAQERARNIEVRRVSPYQPRKLPRRS